MGIIVPKSWARSFSELLNLAVRIFCMAKALLFAAAAILTLLASPSPAPGQTLDQLQLHKVRAVAVEYRGSNAIHLTQVPDAQGEDTLAILTGPELRDGTIEVNLAGAPAPG